MMHPWTVSSRRCNVCTLLRNSKPSRLKECAGCKLIQYCSRQHQTLDWPLHKELCFSIQRIQRDNNIDHILDICGKLKTYRDLEDTIALIKCALITILKRDLERYECELITFPVHCQVCFERKPVRFFTCENCEAVSYCSKQHLADDYAKHSESCKYLKYYYNYFETKDIRNYPIDFKMTNVNVCNLPKDIFELLQYADTKNTTFHSNPKTLEEYQSYAIASGYSCVATLLYVLYTCNVINNDNLIIYVVGSRDEIHYFHKFHCKLLLSLLPKIKNLSIYLIGPEMEKKDTITYKISFNNRHTTVTIHFHSQLFQNFIHSKMVTNNDWKHSPNIIVCFNCGFYEFSNTKKDTWKDGIYSILQFSKIPIVFTSYTNFEAQLDSMKFNKYATECNKKYEKVMKSERNPYKDFRPFRNMEVHDEEDLVYFRNGYINVVIVDEN